MYSKKVLDELWKRNIEIGDRIAIEFGGKENCGVLLENFSENTDIIEIKLDNGYNVGIKFNESIRLVKKKAGKTGNVESGESDERYKISVLMFGGTISSKVEYTTGAVFPATSPSEFREAFPELKGFGGAGFRNVMSLLSEDMNSEHWEIMGKEIYDEIKRGKPVVATHGTDTMGYSAAALSFMIQNPNVPVVFTGAQRSSDRGSSDAKENMLNAAYYASAGRPGVFVCMHASTNDGPAYIHLGTRVRKMHTSRRDAFKSINVPPVATVDYSKKRIEYTTWEWGARKGEMKFAPGFSDNVAMLYIHPGIKPEIVRKFSEYDGVVLLVTGLGHVPTNPFGDKHAKPILNEVGELVDSGVVVVAAPQTINGRLNLNVYTAGRMLKEKGVIGHGCDWLPETAFVKLCWVLGQTKEKKKVEELMYTNIAGELSERSQYVDF